MTIEVIETVVFDSVIPGALGGLAWFLCGLKCGRIKNNKFTRKLCIEVLGAVIVSFSISYAIAPIFSNSMPIKLISFAMGASWSGVVQIFRSWITRNVEQFLNVEEKRDVA